VQARSASNVKGIDVSHWQGKIDWAKVAGDGVKFAFIKATDGATAVDSEFVRNAAEAAKAGIRVSYYHYARPEKNDAAREAARFASAVKGKRIDWPLALDVEGEAAKLGRKALTAWCLAFLRELEKLTGRPGMLYTGASFAKTHLDKELASFPLWVAHYGTNKPMANPTWERWAVFQYTSQGKVAGIAGNVDVNAMEAEFYERYAGEELEEGMTKEEKEAFERLSGQVGELTKAVGELGALLKTATEKIQAPKWFVDEFGEGVVGHMSDPTGTRDFWRSLAVSLRVTGYEKN